MQVWARDWRPSPYGPETRLGMDVKVSLLFFAKSRELTGISCTEIALPVSATGRQLFGCITSVFPSLSSLGDSVILAVNQEYVSGDQQVQLKPGDEVAVIPPISGGMSLASERDLVRISPEPISQEEVTEFVTDPSIGGISLFIGVTRDHFQGKKVVRLEYEAYTAMAERQLRQICSDVRKKWPVHRIAVIHRIGVVPVSEASIVIAVSAEHRKEAIEAVAFVIEVVKSGAAIWKKEIYEEGEGQWKENKECSWKHEKS